MRGVSRSLRALVLSTSLLLSLAATANKPSPLYYKDRRTPLPDLQYDYYRKLCPKAESIVRSAVEDLHSQRPSVAPELLRLAFHDCFVKGCDGSVLLDGTNGMRTEKDAPPNRSLKGFELINTIKEQVEKDCPATVSCADIVVLAARDGLLLIGGPFYPVLTGRSDAEGSFPEVASSDLPAPNEDLTTILTKFKKKGFSERETVALLGGHNIGRIRCRFLRDRLYNFSGTGSPDASLDPGFLREMRAVCPNTVPLPGPEAGVAMGFDSTDELRGTGFDNHYYKSLVKGRGILHSDQQLMAGRSTALMVFSYASDDGGDFAFKRDFARAMVRMSSLGGYSGPRVVRSRCWESAR